MVNDKEKCVNYFNRLVNKLYNLKWVTAKDADEAKKEYFKFITAVQNEHNDAFLISLSLENAGMSYAHI